MTLEELNKIIAEIKENPNMQELDLATKALTDTYFLTIIKALEENQTITKLNVSDNYISANCVPALITLINDKKTIKELDISNNRLGNNAAFLAGECYKNLEFLDVSSNRVLPSYLVHQAQTQSAKGHLSLIC